MQGKRNCSGCSFLDLLWRVRLCTYHPWFFGGAQTIIEPPVLVNGRILCSRVWDKKKDKAIAWRRQKTMHERARVLKMGAINDDRCCLGRCLWSLYSSCFQPSFEPWYKPGFQVEAKVVHSECCHCHFFLVLSHNTPRYLLADSLYCRTKCYRVNQGDQQYIRPYATSDSTSRCQKER